MQENLEPFLRGGQFKRIIETGLTEIRKETGLKRVEIEIIHCLYICGEKNTMKDICTNLQMNKGHISTALDNLCREHYVNAIRDKEDRRHVHYFLTEKSVPVAEEISTRWDEIMSRLIKGIPVEGLEQFKKVAKMIGKNMDELLDD